MLLYFSVSSYYTIPAIMGCQQHLLKFTEGIAPDSTLKLPPWTMFQNINEVSVHPIDPLRM